jgi:hypothetical protein
MSRIRASLALAILLCACDENKAPVAKSDQPVVAAPSGQPSTSTSASASVGGAVPAWATPEQLCVHTIAVCDQDQVCSANKTRLNSMGVFTYQLFDKECVKTLVKRQNVLGAKYESCAACLRDANDPKTVQACMFEGGICHGN